MARYIVNYFLRIANDYQRETHDRLTTVGPQFLLPVGKKGRTCAFQVCECKCGEVVVSRVDDLRNGRIQSCGCLQSQNAKERSTYHGMANTAEFKIWLHIEQRCTNPNRKGYENYGGRGIKVCDEWTSKKQPRGQAFMNFLNHVGPRPSENHTIDRIDVNGDYAPGNVRWATIQEQANNRTNNRILEFQGRKQNVSMWAKELGLSTGLLHSRLALGWTAEEALTMPSDKGLRRQSMVYKGEKITWTELAARHNIRADTLKWRVEQGWTMEEALNTPVKKNKASR